MQKKGKLDPLIIALDLIGFTIILIGAGLIRYSLSEVISILGGFVMAGGVTLLTLTRIIPK
jgi:hypothetical protein